MSVPAATITPRLSSCNVSLAMQSITCLATAIAFCVSTTALAQDLVAVGWMGSIWRVDSLTGTATQTGTGLFGQNATAMDNQGRVWSTTRTPNTPYVYGFTVVDPIANTATQMFPGVDLRGMASTGTTMLWALQDGAPDTLNMLDTTTGTLPRSAARVAVRSRVWRRTRASSTPGTCPPV
jgi:hypothetical protein